MDSVDIPVIEDFADIAALDRYVEIPADWWVAAADVQGSTTAIRAGRYKDVNLLGVSTIAAVVNALKPLRVPFVFGGDGATFCVPGTAVGAVRAALASVRALGRESFGLELRIGVVPVSAVRAAGKRVLVAYFRSSPTYLQAVFAGGGMSWAERVLKDEARSGRYAIPGDGATAAGADCGGLECRWSEIVSPHGETVALLVQATGYDDASESETYRAAIAAIDATYGDARRSHPVSADRLRLGPASALGGEQAVRTHRRGLGARALYAVGLRAQQLIGRFLFATGVRFAGVAWGSYRQEVVDNTDRRKFDDTLRIIISGTPEQRATLDAWLSERQRAGHLVYGMHVSPAALMTCLIGDRAGGDHVHFVDGSEGGYAMAAVDLKRRLKDSGGLRSP